MPTKPSEANKIVLPKLTSTVKSRTVESKTPKDALIPNQQNHYSTRDPKTLRSQGLVTEAIRVLSKENGNLSTSVYNMVQIADSGWKVAAYLPSTSEFSEEGTMLAKNVIASMDTLHDYTEGFGRKRPIPMIVQTLLREGIITSGCAIELVLDKGLYPDRFQVVDYSTLKWASDGKGSRYPVQTGFESGAFGGDPGIDIKLDIATFYAETLHLEADTAYGTSILRASLDSSFASSEFIADMRRSLFKSGHSRLTATLDTTRIAETASPEVKKDSVKLAAYLNKVKGEVEEALADMSPEDSVVAFDTVVFKTEDIGGTKSDYTGLLAAINNQEATALKTPPSILGMRSAGSQSLSNSETLIFLKGAAAIQTPVEAIMSRALTTAVRLYGSDVYVKFKFNPIDLRPESELEAFHTMKETRLLRRLSLGLITDAQFYYEMDIPPNPAAPKLSGTNFQVDGGSQSTQTTRGGMEDNLQPDSDVPRNGGGSSQ
jgi:hypothetical protein